MRDHTVIHCLKCGVPIPGGTFHNVSNCVGFNPSDGYEGGDGLGRFESRSGRFGGNLFNVVGAGWMLLSTMVSEL